MALKTSPFDAAEYLDDDEAIAEYVTEALETNDPAYIAHAIGVVARAKGMTLIARETGLSREGLYRALSEGGNPEFATVVGVLNALGIQLHAGARKPAPKRKAAAKKVAGEAAPKRKVVARSTRKAAPKKPAPKKAPRRRVARKAAPAAASMA